MMSYLICGMMLLSFVAAALNGNMAALSSGVMSGCKEAVELAFSICGSIALWSGIMRVAQESGITEMLAKILMPITHGLLFPKLKKNSRAIEAISMSMTVNLLGLGNAATPLGIAVMKELEEEANYPEVATEEMIVFVALNTASIQLIPTTTAFLRLQHGSTAPMSIVGCVWIASLCSVTAAVGMAKLLCKVKRFRTVTLRTRRAKSAGV